MDVHDVLAHSGIVEHADYDPVARRQRYLKTRKLKGRRRGQAVPAPKAGLGSRVVESGNASSSVHVPKVNQTAARQAASTARQVAVIQGRLNSLKAHLGELLAKKKAESQSSSSSDSKDKSSDSSEKESSDKSTADKPKTAKQKAAAKEALKKAQETRAKEQKATPDKPEEDTPSTSLSLDEQITKTREVIRDVEAKLRTVKEQSRT